MYACDYESGLNQMILLNLRPETGSFVVFNGSRKLITAKI